MDYLRDRADKMPITKNLESDAKGNTNMGRIESRLHPTTLRGIPFKQFEFEEAEVEEKQNLTTMEIDRIYNCDFP